MLAHKYKGQDPTEYYISEKLDGMRCIYDGVSDVFISRNNKEIIFPKFFTKNFPSQVLDGELYTKRQDFKGTGIFRKKVPIDYEWKHGVYMVFDLPMIKKPFEERYQMLKDLVKKANSPYLKLVEHIKVKSKKY
jgi:DNA ligase-1